MTDKSLCQRRLVPRLFLVGLGLLLPLPVLAMAVVDPLGNVVVTKLPQQVPMGAVIDRNGNYYQASGTGAGYAIGCVPPVLGNPIPMLNAPSPDASPSGVGLTPDRTGMVVVYATQAGAMKAYTWTCGKDPVLVATIAAADGPMKEGVMAQTTAMAPSGEICLSHQNGNIYCIDAVKKTAKIAISAAEIDAIATAPAGLPALSGLYNMAIAFAADGTLFALISRPSGPAPGRLVHWVLARKPGGKIALRLGPMVGTGATAIISPDGTPLGGTTSIHYVPALDAMMIGVVAGWEWRSSTMGAQFGDATGSWQGFGVRIVPVSDAVPDASGYLGLDRAFKVIAKCTLFDDDMPCPSGQMGDVSVGQDDKVEFILTQWAGSGAPETNRYRVDFDPTALDLDEDGLTAAEEKALGTSDFLLDSDGGGTRDDVEKRLNTNPALASDDPLKRGTIAPMFVLSPLIRMRLEDFEAAIQGPPKPASVTRPLCSGKTNHCFGANGEYVLDAAAAGIKWGYNARSSEDGKFVAIWTPTTIDVLHFADGIRKQKGNNADVSAAMGVPNGVQLILAPVDETHIYILSHAADARTTLGKLTDDLGATKVFDEKDLNAKSNQPQNDPFHYFGASWDPLTKELLIAAKSSSDAQLIGLSADGSLRRFASARGLVGLAGSVREFISGGLPQLRLGQIGPLGIDTGHEFLIADGQSLAYDGSYLNTLVGSYSPHDMTLNTRRAWSDTLHYDYQGGKPEDGDYELVRTTQPNQPGDLLVAGTRQPDLFNPSMPNMGTRLSTSPPRGSLLPLTGFLQDVKSANSLDLAANGNACLADSIAENLLFLKPDLANFNAPTDLQWKVAVTGLVACKLDAKGQVHALATGPARVELHDGADGHVVSTQSLTLDGPPLDFYIEKDGTYHIVESSKHVTGALRLSDGRLLEAVKGELQLDGVNIGVKISDLFKKSQIVGMPGSEAGQNLAPVHMVERPDHTVAILAYAIPDGGPAQATTVFVLDLLTKRHERLFVDTTSLPSDGPAALAIVPGGTWKGPWANEGKSATGGTGGPDAGGTGDATADGGAAATAGAPAASSGCSAARAGSPWAMLGVALFLGLARGRRVRKRCRT